MKFIQIYINWSYILHPFKSGGMLHGFVNLYKRKKNGAGCCDVYSLYYYLGKIILPSLKVFKKSIHGYPYTYVNEKTKEEMTEDKWNEILDKMIYSFESIELDETGDEIDYARQQEGFELFGYWYRSLWI